MPFARFPKDQQETVQGRAPHRPVCPLGVSKEHPGNITRTRIHHGEMACVRRETGANTACSGGQTARFDKWAAGITPRRALIVLAPIVQVLDKTRLQGAAWGWDVQEPPR